MMPQAGPTYGMCIIYRNRNAALVSGVIEAALRLPQSCQIALWSLDDTHPTLARWTVGTGPGLKFEILNLLIEHLDTEYIIFSDDDIQIDSGDMYTFLQRMRRYEFDLAQPSHSATSLDDYAFLFKQRDTDARLTTFVEIGPLFAVGPKRRSDFLPFPEDFGMGWGLELRWYDKALDGARLGVVDAAEMTHLYPPGTGEAYDATTESERLSAELESRNLREWPKGLEQIQKVLRAWPCDTVTTRWGTAWAT